MDSERRAHLHAKLRLMRDEMEAAGALKVTGTRDSTGVSSVDDDAKPLIEMAQVIASKRNQARHGSLKAVRRALNLIRIEPEDYGCCEDCQEPIGDGRLDLMPYARLCLKCQAAHDPVRGQRRQHLHDRD